MRSGWGKGARFLPGVAGADGQEERAAVGLLRHCGLGLAPTTLRLRANSPTEPGSGTDVGAAVLAGVVGDDLGGSLPVGQLSAGLAAALLLGERRLFEAPPSAVALLKCKVVYPQHAVGTERRDPARR